MASTHAKTTRAAAPPLPTSREDVFHRALVDTSEARRFGVPRRDPRDEAEADAAAAAGQERGPSVDFSKIRIHTDAEADALARDLGAAAFTRGGDIYFRKGAWAPGTPAGNRLLAHELTHVQQQQRSGNMAVQCSPETDVQAELDRPVGADDTSAQAKRVVELTSMFNGLSFDEADVLLKRLTKRASGDKLAEAFHHRLSTHSRERLLGILQGRARSVPLSLPNVDNPARDPKYIDKIHDVSVRSAPLSHGVFELIWKGGKQTILHTEVDWKGGSHVFPLLDVYSNRDEALAAAKAWPIAKSYHRAVTFYRGKGGTILPTWFSRETAPETYDLIIDVEREVLGDLQAAEDFFRGLRNGMIVGAVLVPFFRGFIRVSGGGAGPKLPASPKGPPAATNAPVIDPVATDPAQIPTDSAAAKSSEGPRAAPESSSIPQLGRPVNATVNVGGGLEPGSEAATNLNPIKPGSGGPSRGIPNHVKAGFEDIGNVFEPGSVHNIISNRLRYGDVDWQKAAEGSAKVMANGGKLSLNIWTQTQEEVRAVVNAFKKAGFKDVRPIGSGPSTIILGHL